MVMKVIEIYMNINGCGVEVIIFYEEVFNIKVEYVIIFV